MNWQFVLCSWVRELQERVRRFGLNPNKFKETGHWPHQLYVREGRRMEPVFMILGQSAGAAAILAITDKVSVQNVDYGKLKQRLLAGGAVTR